jgi:hypothetical protein
MKNLDLSAMGVQGMNVDEMKKVNGGSWGFLLFAAICIVIIYIAGGEAIH